MNRGTVFLAATALVALVFSAEAALRLARLEFYVLRFAVLGYPPWMVWAVSLAQMAGAAMLLWPGTFRAGVSILGVVSAGFLVTHLANGDGGAVWAPLAMLCGLAGLVVMRRTAGS